MERSGETARKLATKTDGHAPLKTFETLIARWEMNNEPPPPASLLADTSASSMTSPSTGATSRCPISDGDEKRGNQQLTLS